MEDWIRNEGLPHVPDRGRLIFDRAQVATWAATRGLAARAGFLAPANKAFTTGVGLDRLLRAGGIWRDVDPADVRTVLDQVLARLPGATDSILALLRRRVNAVDGLNWAPVGHGFALPHLRERVALGRESGCIALLLLHGELPAVGAVAPPDDEPVRRLFFFLAPSPRAHLDILGGLSRHLNDGEVRRLVEEGADDPSILRALAEDPSSQAGAVAQGGRS